MAKESTLDIELLNLFYLGSYDSCISQCTKVSNPTVANRLFEFRSNIALGQYQYVFDELEEKQTDSTFINDTGVKAVETFAKYQFNAKKNNMDEVKACREQLEKWLDDPSKSSNPTLQVIAAIIYNEEEDYMAALKAVHNPSNLEMYHLFITTLLKINRVDLASNATKKMQELNDDATLTQLTLAIVNVAIGGPQKVQEALYIYRELNNKFPDSVVVLNGLAIAHMTIGEYELAEQQLQTALTKKSNDTTSLVNMIVCQTHLKNERQVKRYTTQLKSVDPNHSWLQERKVKSDEFDAQNANYGL